MAKRSVLWGMLAAGVVTGAACSPARDDTEAAAQIGAEIIGGTLASAYPEAAYLNIDMTAAGGYACSAVVIAPKVVLTAGHCVDGHSTWEVHVGSQVRTSKSGLTYDWKENGATTVNPLHHDLGLVFLDTAVTVAQFPTVASAKEPDGTKVMDIGRVLNGTLTNQLYGATTTISDGSSTGYPYDYVATDVIQSGDSGGPVFTYGTHKLVAINSGAGGGIEVLARVDLLSTWIQQQIAAHGGGGADSGTTSPADAGAVDSGSGSDAGSTPSTPPACSSPAEVEPNNDWKSASSLVSGSLCGTLSSTTDQDWYSVSFGPGSVTVELTGTGDALFAVGIQDNATTCTPTLTGLRQVSLSSPKARKMCVVVASPNKSLQTYGVTRR